MAYVDVVPTTPEAEATLQEMADIVQRFIREHLKKVWKRSDEDIIVPILKCIVLVPDPVAVKLGTWPDVLIKVNTNDPLQNLAETLADSIVATWREEIGDQLKAENWIRFFHTWRSTFM